MSRKGKTILLVLLGVSTLGLVAVLAAKTAGAGDDDRTATPATASPAPLEPATAPATAPAAAPTRPPFVRRTEPAGTAAEPAMPTRIERAPEAADPGGPGAEGSPREEWRAAQLQRRQEVLATYDKDGNGELDETERQTMRQERLATEFKNLDKNGDGTLSIEEFQAMEGLRGAGRRLRDRPEGR